MKICSLSSCSGGNAYLAIGRDGTAVLIDCGLSLRRLEAWLEVFGVDPRDLAGVFMTHEHADHVRALRLQRPFPLRHGLPVYATQGFWRVLPCPDGVDRRRISAKSSVKAGGLTVTAFPKPHDATEPVGYLIEDGWEAAGVATDLGTVTKEIIAALHGVDHLVFESNHDPILETRSGRPPHLIRRVLGDHGHLSNDQAGQALARIGTARTRTILLAHLSEECNRPELALDVVSGHLLDGPFDGHLAVAPYRQPSPLFHRDGVEQPDRAAVLRGSVRRRASGL